MFYWLWHIYVVFYYWVLSKLGKFQRKEFFDDVPPVEFRIMPWHIDYNFHLNNATYLTLFEYARVIWGIENGLMQDCYSTYNSVGLAGLAIQFRREVRLFEKVLIETKPMCDDDRFLYIEQVMYVYRKGKKEFVSRLVMRSYALDAKKRKIITPVEFMCRLWGYSEQKSKEVWDMMVARYRADPRAQALAQVQDSMKEGAPERFPEVSSPSAEAIARFANDDKKSK